MNKMFFLGCIIAISLLVAIGFWMAYHNGLNSKDYTIFHYELRIKTNSTEIYRILVPVPLASRVDSPLQGLPTQLMKELKVTEGSMEYSVTNSTYGWALNISCSGNASIIGHKEFQNPQNAEDRDYHFEVLSMTTASRTIGPHRVYFNSSVNISLDFSCYNRRTHPRGGHNLEWGIKDYVPTDGWQTVNIYIDSRIAG